MTPRASKTARNPKASRTAKTPRRRHALSNLGGPTRGAGDPELAALLARAWNAALEPADRLTHGFHAYPARMHPGIARVLVSSLSEPGQRVLDPFCGSGTVLIEALCQGRRGAGVDLNPLALRIAEVCCDRRGAASIARFGATLESVTEASLARVRQRRPVRAPISARERAHYAPHVLLELAGLVEEIAAVTPRDDRRALQVVFSSLLVKLSTQRADTSEQRVDKRLRKGLASELFLHKGRELCARWRALAEATASITSHRVVLREGDARELGPLLGQRRVELIATSPPYGGTYDYHRHHARRYPWLGLSATRFAHGEIGARRRLSRLDDGAQRWERELSACLSAMVEVLAPKGQVVLLLGDAEVAGRRVDAVAQIARLAPRAGLDLMASASQPRTDYLGKRPRHESLLLLCRSN